MAQILMKYAGEFLSANKVSIRTLSKTTFHFQNAINRAYLSLQHRNLWKYTKVHTADYPNIDFLIDGVEEGSFVLRIIKNTDIANRIITRLADALNPAFEIARGRAEQRVNDIANAIANQQRALAAGQRNPIAYQELIENPPPEVIRDYADRAIVREIDQLSAPLRSSASGDSAIKLTLTTNQTREFEFTKQISKNFHKTISHKSVGQLVRYNAKITSLDTNSLRGKFINIETRRQTPSVMHFRSAEDVITMGRFLGSERVSFIGAPFVEYGAFDPHTGDIVFIALEGH